MLLGFKEQFAEMVRTGAKRQTIRAESKRLTPLVGELIHCYTGLRTKNARLLGRWRCVNVQEIKIRRRRGDVLYPLTVDLDEGGELPDWQRLNDAEMERLFTYDGFIPDSLWTATAKAARFFKTPFHGFVINWDWTTTGAALPKHEFGIDHQNEFDEVFISEAFVHIERMADQEFWIGIDSPNLPRLNVRTGISNDPKSKGSWYFLLEEDALAGSSFLVQRPRK